MVDPEDLPDLEEVVLLLLVPELVPVPAFAFVVEDFDPDPEADVLLLPLFEDEDPPVSEEELDPLVLPVLPVDDEGELEELPEMFED